MNENASLVKYEPPKCDECRRKIVVLSDLCAKCAADIGLNDNKQDEPVQPDFSDAYQGARQDAEIWKKRALEAEELNRKFIAQINDETFMGEPAQPVQPVEPVAHIFPSDLDRFKTEETFARAYSIPCGNPDEITVPVFRHPPADVVRELYRVLDKVVRAMSDYEMDTDESPPFKHRQMMREAKATLTKAKEHGL